MKRNIIIIISLLMIGLFGCSSVNGEIDSNDIKMVIIQDNGFVTKSADNNQVIEGYPSCVVYGENSVHKYVSLINGLALTTTYSGEEPEFIESITVCFVHNDNSVEKFVFGTTSENYYIEHTMPNGETIITIHQTPFDELHKIMSSEAQYTYIIDSQDIEAIVSKYSQLCITCHDIPSLAD